MARKSSKQSSSSPLANLSARELHAEIRRRQQGSKSLLRRREKLLAKLAAVNAQIAAAGVGSGGVRARNAQSLPEALRAVLKGKTMGVTEVAKAVQDAGYQTTAANFRTIVNAALIKKGNKFKRVGRGQYTAG